MGENVQNAVTAKVGAFAPLGTPTFRNIWTASVLSNLGQLILGVGAAWEMTRLSNSPGMVALVQTAMMLPLMLVALPAGAFADMFDRRKIAMGGLAVSIVAATALTILAMAGQLTPWIILTFCVLIGIGVALYSPAWQSSISEQVPPHQLPAAVALGSVSYNFARSFGPALGGLIVLAAGAQAAFAVNAVFYVPLLLTYLFWKRQHVPSRLPPERIDRAIVSGVRYAFHSRPIRNVLARAFLFGFAGSSITALAPLIARDTLQGDAGTYGLLLGFSGGGAVIGAFLVGWFRQRLGTEGSAFLMALLSTMGIAVMGFSKLIPLSCIAMFISGGASITTIALYNISVQLGAPRWVTARALSLFSSALTGGIAIGAATWGLIANAIGMQPAMYASAALMFALPLVGKLLRLPEASDEGVELIALGNEPQVNMALSLRSGPIVIEIDYKIEPTDARSFYDAMLKVQRTRLRNGGFDWSLSRDIADPAIWTERYQCPTWGDYLRMRGRYTQADMDLHAAARGFDLTKTELAVRRKLERPFGSVRWQSETPDPGQESIGYIGP